MNKFLRQAYLYAVLSVLLWSTSATAFKITLRLITFRELLFLSTITATIFLFILIIIRGEIKEIFHYKLKDYFYSALLGFLNPFLYYVVLFKAYSLLPAQLAQPLNFVWPLTTVIFSVIFLHQKLKIKGIFGLCISFSGVIFISSQGKWDFANTGNGTGIFLALFSSIIWGLFFILNVRDKRSDIHKLALNFGFGSIYVLSYTLVGGFEIPELNGLFGSIYIGLFEMGITFVFWLKALSYRNYTAKVANLIYITPFLSMIFIYFVLKERILPTSIVGLILIVSGILIQNTGRKNYRYSASSNQRISN